MEGISAKAYFLRQEFIPMLRKIDPQAKPVFGKMNMQQMVEHMSYSVRQANGKDVYELVTPEDQIPKWQDFIRSDKEFRENTKNKMLPDEPLPLRNKNLDLALEELKTEIEDFFLYFEKHPNAKILNPLFGELDYELWVLLLYKHCRHHLRQFGVNP